MRPIHNIQKRPVGCSDGRITVCNIGGTSGCARNTSASLNAGRFRILRADTDIRPVYRLQCTEPIFTLNCIYVVYALPAYYLVYRTVPHILDLVPASHLSISQIDSVSYGEWKIDSAAIVPLFTIISMLL